MHVTQCSSLQEVRENIDAIDLELIKLIAQRNAYIHQAADFKVSVDEVKAKDRVQEVIARARKEALERNLNPNMIQTLFETMINEMVEVEIAQFRNAKNL